MFKEVHSHPEFEKDLQRLSKRFKTLKEDFKIFQETELMLFHKLQKDNKGIFPLTGLGIHFPLIYKAKKFACRSLKGRGVQSGIRIIYAYFADTDRIEFIEMYFKGDKENEDRGRILRHYKK
jgi:mRNA-degrading endonuclease RelE of RelBE toxin-antitoxin system